MTSATTAELQTVLQTWSAPIEVNLGLFLAVAIYARGWFRLHAAFPDLISVSRFAAFLAGIGSVWIAIGSPLNAFDDVSLTIHMVQHLLLMAIAPPLILLGTPALALLQGLPRWLATKVVGPFLRWRLVRQFGRVISNPAICWLAAMFALIVWHVPAVFELALRWDWLHEIEHASFLGAGLLFWWPVVQPWPSASQWPRWSIPLYLFCATLPCDALSGFLVFCDRVVYSSYLSVPKVFNLSPLQDQQFAAALMWTSITIIFLVPAAVVTIGILSPQETHRSDEALSEFRRITSLPLVSSKLEAN
jgi:cytochrome c oxidase assembly factor CtaG